VAFSWGVPTLSAILPNRLSDCAACEILVKSFLQNSSILPARKFSLKIRLLLDNSSRHFDMLPDYSTSLRSDSRTYEAMLLKVGCKTVSWIIAGQGLTKPRQQASTRSWVRPPERKINS
jgi:hypothetical protein